MLRDLGRVPRQVVELGLRRLDVQPVLFAPPVERRPAETEARVQRLDIGRLVASGLRVGDRRQQAAALCARKRRQAGQVEQRGRDVDPARQRRHDTSGRHAGPGENQRHAGGRVVHEQAMRRLAVLAEALAMIGGGEHDQRDRPAAHARTRSRNRPIWASVNATSPSYGRSRKRPAYGSGGSYGACGSKRWSQMKNGLDAFAGGSAAATRGPPPRSRPPAVRRTAAGWDRRPAEIGRRRSRSRAPGRIGGEPGSRRRTPRCRNRRS